jgi:GT2 family glycosyltransferase
MYLKKLSISVVLYNNSFGEINQLMDSLRQSTVEFDLFIIDNSSHADFQEYFSNQKNITYFRTGRNLGFGRAHNWAMKQVLFKYNYHLVLNPDVYFNKGVLETLLKFMNENSSVGNVMPLVYNVDSTIQYICRKLPKPFDLFSRRFLPKSWTVKRMFDYEMRDTEYSQTMEVPFLSGCFMFIRTSVLETVGLFDEDFYLYFEDLDLNRRIGAISKTVFFPEVSIVHIAKRQSYKSWSLTLVHIKSAIKYFNKYGWFPLY